MVFKNNSPAFENLLFKIILVQNILVDTLSHPCLHKVFSGQREMAIYSFIFSFERTFKTTYKTIYNFAYFYKYFD